MNKRPRTAQEHLRQFLSTADRGNPFEGEACFLPFQIESLTLDNVGPFKKFQARFQRNSVNVVYGAAGSGKSWIIRSILLAFGRRHRYFEDNGLGGGTITLKTFPTRTQCLISDDCFSRITSNMLVPLLSELGHLGIQVIATVNTVHDLKTIQQADVHIIPLQYLH